MLELARLFVCRHVAPDEFGIRADGISRVYPVDSRHVVVFGHLHVPTSNKVVHYLLEVEGGTDSAIGVVYSQSYTLAPADSRERRLIAAVIPVAGLLARGDYLAIITVEGQLQESARFRIQ